MNFIANGSVIGTGPVDNGTATYTTTALPSQTNQLTAVYSGDFTYDGSTSAAVPYTVQPLPSVTLNMPPTVELAFTDPDPDVGHLHQPLDGQMWSSNYLFLEFSDCRTHSR